MKPRMRQFLWAISFGILILLIMTANNYAHRRPFHNEFMRHPDRGLIPDWQIVPGPSFDRFGNVANWDFKTDFVLVFVSGKEHFEGSSVFPHVADDGVTIDIETKSTPIKLRMVPRRLFLMDLQSGHSSEYPLGVGQAKKIWRSFEDQEFDLRRIPEKFRLTEERTETKP